MFAPIRQIAARVYAVLAGSRLERDFNEEIDSHLAMLVDENIRLGMSPEEAVRSARLKLGGVTRIREAHRDTRGLPFFDTLLQDVRYAFRTFRREPGFAVFAVLIVGLGIGAAVTVFSVLNALLIRPLPFSEPNRLVWIANDDEEGDLSGQTVPVGPFVDLREHTQALSDVAAYYAFYGLGDMKMTGGGEPERLSGVPVSQNLFSLLGIQPRLGRFFTTEECQSNSPVAILSAGLWRRRFASDPAIVGRKLTLNDRAVTIIGVMPSSFDFGSVFAPGARIDLFLPLPLTPEINRRGNTLSMIGRLKPGVTVQQAQAEGRALSEPLRVKYNRGELRFKVSLLEDRVRGRLRPALFVLACAVGVVMLIVCANLSNLQLARTAARQKEIAVRVALGAGRGRLIRQMLTESVLLSSCAAAVGLILAIVGTRALAGLDALSLPLRESVRVDLGALAFTIAIAVLTGLLFGVVPALQVRSNTIHDSLKDASRGSSEGRSHGWIRATLVVSEIAFACVLLVGAGLLVRSFLRVLDLDLGFRPERAAALRIDPGSGYNTRAKRNTYFDEALRRVRSVPGIEEAGLTDVLPLGQNRSWSAGAKGQTYSREQPPPDAFVRIVSDGYREAMGIPLRAGRDLTERDTSSTRPVILVNETLARTLWPDRDPVGQTVIYVDVEREVVGVVGDVRHVALEQGSGCEMYLPIRQTNDYSSVDLIVRTTLPQANLARAVRAALEPLDPNLPANEFRTLQQLVDRAVSPRRFIVMLLAGFSVFALLLASLGIYAVISYLVAQRTHEIGIRMALGASAGDVQSGVLLRTFALTAGGMSIGIGLSWILTRTMNNLLFGVTSTDPVTFIGVLIVLTLVAVAAGYVPARRASRIDPMVALRAN